MDEILEGDIGRSFKLEDKEYFVAESIFNFEPMPMPKFDAYRLRMMYEYIHIDPVFDFRMT